MTLPSLLWEASAAVYARLTADATLMTQVTNRVYDDVPDSTAYPYIDMGEAFETDEDAFSQDNYSILLRLHVWSQYQGRKEAVDIMSRVATLLDEYALTVSGATLSRCVVEQKQILRDPDGKTRHGIIDVRVQAGE